MPPRSAPSESIPLLEALEPRLLLSGETRLLVLGSSTVEGVEGVNSFRRPLSKKLDNAGYAVNFIGSKNTNKNGAIPPNPDFDRDNEGHSGWRADSFLTGNLASWLKGKSKDGDDYTPDIAIIYVGHNDLFNNQSPASTASEIGQIIDLLRADNPKVVVLIGQLADSMWGQPGYKSIPNTNVNASIADLNNRLATLAGQKNSANSPVKVVNINAVLDPATETVDGQHPNAAGEEDIANAFFNAIKANFPANVLVSATSGLKTSENGDTASFTVRLSAKPVANVTINLSSSDPSEGVINRSSLVFTPTNWDQPQSVTITGVNDGVRDGNKSYAINLSQASSDDDRFDGKPVPDVSVINADNDGGVSGNVFLDLDRNGSKNGGDADFAGVRVFLDLNNNGQRDNGEAQTLTDANGNYTFDNLEGGVYLVRAVAPDNFRLPVPAREITVGDGKISQANFALNAILGSVIITPTTGLVTTENGGSASFTVRLSKKPTANVVITLSSSNPGEGDVDKTTLVFTPANWDKPQTVTVTGKTEGTVIDGDTDYLIVTSKTTSDDPAYYQIDVDDVSVRSLDNDAAATGRVYFDADGNGSFDSGETTFANLTVFADNNANGRLDAGERWTTTDSSGRYTLSFENAAGVHRLRVLPPAGFVPTLGNGLPFNLPGGATTTRDFPLVQPVDTAGGTTSTARNLGKLATPAGIQEYVGAADRVDLFKIRVRKAGKLKINLAGLGADARVQLLDKSGKRLRRSGLNRSTTKIKASDLPKGRYFIRVLSRDAVDTAYRLVARLK